MTRIFLAFALLVAVGACSADGPRPLDAPGEATFLLSFARDVNCDLRGGGIRIRQNENMLGKAFLAAGQIRSSTLVCTDAAGRQFSTTDHRRVITGSYGRLSLTSLGAGPQPVWGTVLRGRSEFDFRGAFTFQAL